MSFKIGDKVVFALQCDVDQLEYGYDEEMASFVFDGAEGTVVEVDKDNEHTRVEVEGVDIHFSYAFQELMLVA